MTQKLTGLTDKQVERAWQAIGKYTQDILVRSAGDVPGWPIATGSALAGDNKASSPYQVSHLVQSYLVSSTDHLHALCALIFDAQVLNPFAPGAIVRGSIEHAAAAAWVLQPKGRTNRLTRAVQLRAGDARDREKAMRTWGLADEGGKKQAEWVDATATRLGLAKLPHPTNTEILLDISPHVGPGARLTPFSAWQIASGFAHGRQWPTLALLEREQRDTTEPDVLDVRFTNSLERLLPLAWVARNTLEYAVTLYDERGSKPVPPAARRRS